jgi:hypothetical protein
MKGSYTQGAYHEHRSATLFEACPKCLQGDLQVDCLSGDRISAKCLHCGYAGVLQSTYECGTAGKGQRTLLAVNKPLEDLR